MSKTTTVVHPLKIVVIDQGWVVIGRIEERARKLVSTETAVIRKWGTDAGLGQLALYGKREETILDPCGRIEIPIRSVLFTIDCDEERWTAEYPA